MIIFNHGKGSVNMAFVKFKPIAASFYFHIRVDKEEIKEEINNYVTDNERVVYSYKSKRDVVIFTDKRLLLIDKKGIRGFRRSIYGINFSSISSYELSVRKFDSKIVLIMDSGHRVMMSFFKGIDLNEVNNIYKYISTNAIRY
jgi:hypothetical protein